MKKTLIISTISISGFILSSIPSISYSKDNNPVEKKVALAAHPAANIVTETQKSEFINFSLEKFFFIPEFKDQLKLSKTFDKDSK